MGKSESKYFITTVEVKNGVEKSRRCPRLF